MECVFCSMTRACPCRTGAVPRPVPPPADARDPPRPPPVRGVAAQRLTGWGSSLQGQTTSQRLGRRRRWTLPAREKCNLSPGAQSEHHESCEERHPCRCLGAPAAVFARGPWAGLQLNSGKGATREHNWQATGRPCERLRHTESQQRLIWGGRACRSSGPRRSPSQLVPNGAARPNRPLRAARAPHTPPGPPDRPHERPGRPHCAPGAWMCSMFGLRILSARELDF